MRTNITIIILLVFTLIFSAYKEAEQKTNGVFNILGMSEAECKALLKDNLLSSVLSTPITHGWKKFDGKKRVAIVNDLGLYIKSYVNSSDFALDYKNYRESILPGRQEGIDVPLRIEEIKRDIENTEREKKSAGHEHRKSYDDLIASLKEQLEVLQNPNHPKYSLYAGIITLTPEQQEEINRQVAEFNKSYPPDARQYIKLKLKDFLELTSDIDFDAKLVQKNGKQVFENTAYEERDRNWKKCFRAGRETIQASREFATQWLKEIK